MITQQRNRSDPEVDNAFTLIEFIVVMALLASLMAVVAPRISGSVRQRHLDQEAGRLVALTEFGRNEAMSRGVPMVIWIDMETSRFGVEPKSGFAAQLDRHLEYRLPEEIRFEMGREVLARGGQGAIEFAPDGFLETSSVEEVWLRDLRGESRIVARMTNGWGYEVLKEVDYAARAPFQSQ
jgi:type II secretion system protein H